MKKLTVVDIYSSLQVVNLRLYSFSLGSYQTFKELYISFRIVLHYDVTEAGKRDVYEFGTMQEYR